MSEITTVGLDLAKNVFQAHGADASGKAQLMTGHGTVEPENLPSSINQICPIDLTTDTKGCGL